MRIRSCAVVIATIIFLSPMMMEGTRGGTTCSSPADCDDGIFCTVDFCDPDTGCSHLPAVGTPCQPDNRCYAAGRCDGGVCAPGPFPINCDDFNPCTVDGCDPATGCTHQGVTCNDGNPCTLDTCTPPATCNFLPIDCSDGISCTDDSCDPATGACVYTENGSCTENPKSLGYWQKVCSGTGHTEDSITGVDVNCIRLHSCTYRTILFSEICQILARSSPQQTCLRARSELLALILNICHSRLTASNGIDSHCADNASVGEALAEADSIMCDPAPTEDGCDLAGCIAREINQGRALHVHALVVERLASGSLRVSWMPPVADVDQLAATPRRYRVWRGDAGGGPFVQIAEVANPVYEDSGAGEPLRVYDVTPVW